MGSSSKHSKGGNPPRRRKTASLPPARTSPPLPSTPATSPSKVGSAVPVPPQSTPTKSQPYAVLGSGEGKDEEGKDEKTKDGEGKDEEGKDEETKDGEGKDAENSDDGFTKVGGEKTDRQLAREAAYKKRRSTDRKHMKASYFPGVIFSTAYYEQDYDPVGKLGDYNFTATELGGVQGKFRKMVVVRQFDTHCVALPIFTYQGRGLKKNHNPFHHINIRDTKDKNAKKVVGAYPPLLANRRNDLPPKAYHFISEKSFCHITLPTSHKYAFFATLEATLDDNSTKRLQDIFTKQMKLT